MVYFDNSATTKMFPESLETFLKVNQSYFGNPSSLHAYGAAADELLSESRKQVANLLKVSSREIFFTSGGTEGNNWVIKGTALIKYRVGKHIITSSVEHSSVSKSLKQLENFGFEVTYLPVNSEGKISLEELQDAIRKDTILVSIMSVNNEVGTIQPIEEVAELLTHYPTIHFHVDAVQAISGLENISIHPRIDFFVLSAHKFNGPKGVGILYKKNGKQIASLLTGGDQEFGERSTTENVGGIAATAKSLRITMNQKEESVIHTEKLKNYIRSFLKEYEDVNIYSPLDGASHILCFAMKGVRGEVLVHALEKENIYISTTSACASKKASSSSTLHSMGIPTQWSQCAVRLSFSFENTMEEAQQFVNVFKDLHTKFQKIQ
ncbi:cysteine desulfurase [Jeotgalibaca sp. MA1X17-3]|uniref:cysteine desulfurase family protein n=1 Tax=Jeotgalibaca sp. MA1X17-3 TaxID=2908211 RepID=UPI001F15ED46|nr:cysteine desulfurase family protein [Jeotgalibaca sp. MA1X17-3]UJF15107.1 cysteine desulfurase [Jeotgalibaca sp. MA1X17-3]